jgi:hypothetical protein
VRNYTLFKPVAPLVRYHLGPDLAWISHHECFMQVAQEEGGHDLTVEEATRLRDWITAALPTEGT